MPTNEAQVTVSGYVATTPTFRMLGSGSATAKFRLAYAERYRNRETGEWSDGETTFLTVQCWRKLAEHVAASLRKGEPVLVRGRLQTRKFTSTDGQQRSVLEIDASSIGHDLARGVAVFSRARKAPGETAVEYARAAGASGLAAGGGAGPVDGAPAGAEEGVPGGGAVVDESAVAEFVRELDESLPGAPE